MVFLLYVVYERLLPLAESAEDFHGFLRLHRLRAPFAFLGLAPSGYYFHGFLCPHRLRAPVCFSRSDTQWLVSLAESAEDFDAFHRLHCL